LAELGFSSFRIDLSGVGDSPPRTGEHSIVERWAAEVRTAMTLLEDAWKIDRFVLVGNCSGAAMALFTGQQDARVVGTVLINLQGERTSLRYYLKLALTNPKIWRRLLKGTARYRDILKALGGYAPRRRDRASDPGVRSAAVFDMDAAVTELGRRETNVLVVYCSWDPGLDHYNRRLRPKFTAAIPRERFEAEIIPGLNHDFNLVHGQKRLCELVYTWAERL
jgi:pimeloyl-ACP methyl ester carboxylesterase